MSRHRCPGRWLLALAVGVGLSIAGPALTLPGAVRNPAAQAMCAGMKGDDGNKCRIWCRSWPANNTCMLTLRFGSKGLTALRRARRYGIERGARMAGLKSADQRAFRWVARIAHSVRDRRDPTVSRVRLPEGANAALSAWLGQLNALPRSALRKKAAILDELVYFAQRAYGPEDIGVQRFAMLAGQFAGLGSNPQRALELLSLSAKIAAKHLPQDHPHRNEAAIKLGEALVKAGKVNEGLKLLLTSLERYEAVMGSWHRSAIDGRRRLASTLSLQGQYPEAIAVASIGLAVAKRVLGPRHRATGTFHYTLGTARAARNDVLRARVHLMEAMSILGGRGMKPSETMRVHNAMGLLDLRLGNHARADTSFKKAYGLMQRSFGLEIDAAAVLMHNMADVADHLGRGDEAYGLHTRALDFRLKQFGPLHPKTLDSRARLAAHLAAHGRYGEAIKAHEAVLQGRLKLLPAGHAKIGHSHANVASLQWFAGRKKDASAHMEQALQILQADFTRSVTPKLSDTQALLWVASRRGTLDQALTMLTAGGLDAGRAFDLLLQWQGVATRNAMARIHGKLPTVDRAGVCAGLQREGATLIDFAAYQHTLSPRKNAGKPDIQTRYLAFVLRPGDCAPKVVALGSKDALDATIKDYRAAVGGVESCFGKRGRMVLCRAESRQMAAASKALHEALFKPVATLADGAPRLRVVTDDRVGDVPFEALIDGQGKFLLERHSFAYAPFPALLGLPPTARDGRSGRAMVVGDIDYDRKPDLRLAAMGWQQCGAAGCKRLDEELTQVALADVDATRSGVGGCGYKAQWQRLATEAAPIAEMLGKKLGMEVALATGESAVEPLVASRLPGARIVHLATHGFFANPDQCAGYAMRGALQAVQGKEPARGPLVDISRLSAVVLSGANTGKGETDNDALLDGSEIAQLDLSATELVVLSACETGLGVHFAGEGSLSLARGFLLAGAQQVIQSLWQVPSKATAQLFADFYGHWLKGGMSVADALRKAKLQAIGRAKGAKADAGYSWAAFVQVGR